MVFYDRRSKKCSNCDSTYYWKRLGARATACPKFRNNFCSNTRFKVLCISSPNNAKGIIASAIEDPNPVIIFEHRWVHELKGHVPKKYYKTKLGKAKILKKGKDITLVSSSYMIIECLRCAEILKNYSINIEVVDIQSLRPLDIKTIVKSIKKQKKQLLLITGV